MTQLTLTLKDENRREELLTLLSQLDFVEVEEEDDGYEEPTKEEIIEGIRQGLEEVRLIEEGKMKGRSLKQLLDEL